MNFWTLLVWKMAASCTVFENQRKSLIQHCKRSELRLHFMWTKVNQKCQKWSILASFWKPEACGQIVLPDRSVFIEQKLVENAKIKIFKCDILSNFQTMCSWSVIILLGHHFTLCRTAHLHNQVLQPIRYKSKQLLKKLSHMTNFKVTY